MPRLTPAVALLLSLALPAVGLAQDRPAARSDDFILGYASRLLEEELQVDPAALSVSDGVVTYPAPGLGQIERDRLRRVLSGVPGVVGVELPSAAELATSAPTAPAPTAPAPTASAPTADGAAPPDESPDAARAPAERRPNYVLSRGRLFEPLIADPKWPHFFAGYTYYTQGGAGSDGLDNAARVGFGETISFYRRELGGDDRDDTGRRLDAGIQAAVFALFDLDAASHDLINADYFIGPYVAYRGGDLSAIARVYHQSSHLGDEFLLRDDTDRVNLSFEAVDLLGSYELPAGFRVYGGGSYLFHKEPSDLDPFAVQYGGEWRSRTTYADGYLRPIAAADLQHRQETDFDLDLSLRAGVQLEDPSRFSQQLQLLLEYYNGRSPNGQFYDDRIQYVGLGLHLYF